MDVKIEFHAGDKNDRRIYIYFERPLRRRGTKGNERGQREIKGTKGNEGEQRRKPGSRKRELTKKEGTHKTSEKTTSRSLFKKKYKKIVRERLGYGDLGDS
ncbi:hypothetical protein [Methanosarcina sp. MTP4]|uniref:hypothetical protein n=1 Tax=Methanosarcina sp. MTP4 TaxID=1434100 RepID=UPI0018CDD048|nr:hypothetical protein [Methanosarcina sp. MTP4]